MKIKIISTRRNSLLGREEVKFKVVDSNITPRRSQIRLQVALALQAKPNQVFVREIVTKSGTRKTSGIAHVYDDATEALKIEPKFIIKRNKVTEPEILADREGE